MQLCGRSISSLKVDKMASTVHILSAVLMLAAASVLAIPRPRINIVNPKGIKFEINANDIPGASLVAFHYSINSKISGTSAGQWNIDVRSQSGPVYVHENRNVSLKPGDVVYYWVYAIINGVGQTLLDQSWTVGSASGSDSGSSSSRTAAPPTSSSNGGTLNGRRLRLVFEDQFNSGNVDTGKWYQESSMWGGGNNEFQAYTPLKQNTFIKNGALFIKPTLTTDKYGSSFLYNGIWDINQKYGYCSQSSNYGCKREGRYGMLPPVMSGRLRSKSTIRYGKVEIIAKMPRGDWLWPALWMLPRDKKYGTWPRSGEIDIMEARGNRKFGHKGIEYMGSTLHWGSNWDQNRFYLTAKEAKVQKGPTLADGYHKFTLLWDKSGLDFLLDDIRVVKYSTPSQGYWRWGNLPGQSLWHTNDAPFDQDFYLIINVAVGGTNGYFPDGVNNEGYSKPWRNGEGSAMEKFWNAKDKWYPTWKGEDAAMQVDSVRMWQLE